VFVGDFLDDGQAQAGAFGLGGDIGFEGALEHLLGEAGAIVDHLQPHARRISAFVRAISVRTARGRRGARHGIEGVLHEVVDDLAQLRGVADDGGQARGQFGVQAARLLRGGIEVSTSVTSALRSSGFRWAAAGGRSRGTR
jgi:hypothetical protein